MMGVAVIPYEHKVAAEVAEAVTTAFGKKCWNLGRSTAANVQLLLSHHVAPLLPCVWHSRALLCYLGVF